MRAAALKQTPEPGRRGKVRPVSGESDRLTPGRLIGKGYRLKRRLGVSDGVWLAVDPAERLVVMKMGSRSLIEHEYRILAGLMHPHIVSVTDRVHCDAGSFIVFGYLPGGDLVSLAGLMPRYWLKAAHTIGLVLAWLHSRGIVHRDLKARHVMFDDSNHPRLIDFGSAARIGSPWSIAGTTTVAPSRGNEPVMIGDDLYSYAALLHELLTGAPPAAGRRGRPSGDRVGLARLVDERLNASADTRQPDLAAFGVVIESMLGKDRIQA